MKIRKIKFLIKKNIKNLRTPKKTPAFIVFTIPVFCLMFVILFKKTIMVLQIQLNQHNYLEDKKKLSKVKEGILQYVKDLQHLPEFNNGELNYETYISYYIPKIYREDQYNKSFKVTLYDLKYKHPEQGFIKREDHSDIYIICTIHSDNNNISTAIYANEIEQLLNNRSNITIKEKQGPINGRGSQETTKTMDLKSIARLLNAN